MKDFGQWFNDQGAVINGASVKELPEGVWEDDGKYMTHCRSCENAVEILCDLDEFDPGNYYCWGSPRCCP